MCGRFSLTVNSKQIAEYFDVDIDVDVQLRPRYNISPSQMIPTIKNNEKGKREFAEMKWGLIPVWAKDPKVAFKYKTINARGETVDTTSMYKSAFKSRRCLIPSTGFYEWKKLTEKLKQPYYIHLKDAEIFALAGLYEHWKSPDGAQEITSCTIVTTAANQFMSAIHDRMPVILEPESYDDWLSGKQGKDLIRQYPDKKMTSFPVSTLV